MAKESNELKTWIKIITALYILKILMSEPAHGNKIADEIKHRTKQCMTPNPNALYPLLRTMEEKGYVTGKWNDPDKRSKRIYTITSAGLAIIPDLEVKVADRLTEMERKISVLRQDLLGK